MIDWTVKEIYLEGIKVFERIGGGHFGDVCRGTWDDVTVALKKLKGEQKEDFINEIKILQGLNHPNIVRYYGLFVASNNEVMIVMEYMSKGAADFFLRTQGKEELKTEDLLDMYFNSSSSLVIDLPFLSKSDSSCIGDEILGNQEHHAQRSLCKKHLDIQRRSRAQSDCKDCRLWTESVSGIISWIFQ